MALNRAVTYRPRTGREDNPPAQDPKPGDQPRTFTQDELNTIATREKAQGRDAALREVSEALGMSVEDAAELVKAAKAADDANKTQAQRDAEAAAQAKADAERERAEAAADRHAARLERLLTGAGAVDAEVAAAAVKVDVGADDDTIKAAIDALKTRVPVLFGQVPPPNTDPGNQPAPNSKTTSGWDTGRKVAAARGYGKTD